MLSWMPREHWFLWPYEMTLHPYPGLPEQQTILRRGLLQEPNNRSLEGEQIRRCYIMFGLAVAVSVFQWVLLSHFPMPTGHVLLTSVMFLLLAPTLLLLLILCVIVKSNRCFGCLFYWLFVELVSVTVALLMTSRTVLHIVLSTLASLFTFSICYLLGGLLPASKLPGPRTVAAIIILMTVGGSTILILQIVTSQPIYISIYLAFIFLFTLPLAISHASFLHERGNSSPLRQYLLCVLVMYMEFIAFLIPLYYFMSVHKW